MEIKTKSMGIVTIDEKQLISLPKGLYGFEKYNKFALIQSECEPFKWLQSIEEDSLAFLVIDPFLFCPEYEVDVNDEILHSIDINSPSDVVVLAIVTIPPHGAPVTANLQGPLIINKNNNTCIQAIASDSRWHTKHDIVAEMQRREA